MFKYIFILGRNQELSIAEIKAVLKQDSFDIGPGFLVWQTEKEIDAKKLLDQLGGTIKIGQVFSDKLDEQKMLVQILSQVTKGPSTESGQSKKVFFGFSQYGQNQRLNQIAGNIKKELKQRGFSSRWVTSKEKQLSSVIVKKNKLLSQGAEILIVKNKNQTLLAKTLAVQEFEEYSKRDFGRPARDVLSGTMPPKLAKIMINLAQVSQDATILDPFCGSGTILQEAVLLGYKNLIGSDKSQKAIEDTKKNLEWLYHVGGSPVSRRHNRVKGPDLLDQRVGRVLVPGCNDRAGAPDLPKLYNLDVRRLSQKIKQVDAIITEPYLGPPLKGKETDSQIKEIIKELEKLYLDSFKEFQKILSPKGQIVIIFPIFKNNHTLNILSQINPVRNNFSLKNNNKKIISNGIKKMGFELISPDNLVYSRPEQKVKRKILIFTLNACKY